MYIRCHHAAAHKQLRGREVPGECVRGSRRTGSRMLNSGRMVDRGNRGVVKSIGIICGDSFITNVILVNT